LYFISIIIHIDKTEESYKEIFLTPFNMFPKTKHIETVFIT